jgi:hypothetical protein
LQKKVKGRPSYIYFKDDDFDVMIRLRRELSDLLGEEFNVFRAGSSRADKDMRSARSDIETNSCQEKDHLFFIRFRCLVLTVAQFVH